MKIKITLLISAFFALSLSAQRQHDGFADAQGTKTVMPHTVQKSAMVLDTLLPFPASCGATPYLSGVTNGGYVVGTNFYGDLEKAEFFANVGTGTVNNLLVFFGAKEIVGAADNISAKIYSGTAAAGPSTLLGTSDPVSVSNIDTTGMPTMFTFSNPVSHTGDFFASIEVSTGDDTVGIYHTNLGCQNTAWELWNDNTWNNLAVAWTQGGAPFDVSLFMMAVVDDGSTPCPEPVADFTSTLGSATMTDLQVTFDASGSQNTTSYDWDFGDGNTGTGANPQHSYTANGTFTVELAVTGDCGTDTITDDVVIEGVSIEESAMAQSLSVYPNPAASELNISLQSERNVNLRLLSIDGKQVMTRAYSNVNGEFTATLDISDLPQGVYLLEVESGNGTAQKRVVKK